MNRPGRLQLASRRPKFGPSFAGSGGGPTPGNILNPPSWLGCFRMEAGDMGWTAFSNGTPAGRIVGGETRLFIPGQNITIGSPIFEIADPGTYGTNYLTAPIAEQRRCWYTPEYMSHRGTWRNPAGAGSPPQLPFLNNEIGTWQDGSLYWHEGQQRLFKTYLDNYNTSGFQDWGLLSIELGTPSGSPAAATTIGHGPWRMRGTNGAGTVFYGARAAGGISTHPVTGKMISAGAQTSGLIGSPWGPSVLYGADWPTDSTPSNFDAADIVQANCSLWHYYMGGLISDDGLTVVGPLKSFRRRLHPAIFEPIPGGVTGQLRVNSQGGFADALGVTGSWSDLDYVGGIQWIQGPNRKGVVFCGVVSGSPSQNPLDPDAGHEFYASDLNGFLCSHGFPVPGGLAVTGPATRGAFPFLCCYDPDQLDAVKNSALDYTPEPIWFMNLEATFPGFRTATLNTSGAAKTVAGFYWEQSSRRLFMLAPRCDDSRFPSPTDPGYLIHVMQFDEV